MILKIATVLIFLVATKLVDCQYYVRPEKCSLPDCKCPDSNSTICERLEYYMKNQEQYFRSNTILYFLQGIHTMNSSEISEQTFFVHGVSNFSIVGLGEMEQGYHKTVMQSSAIIDCNSQNTSLVIINSSNILISGITMKYCGRHLIHLLKNKYFYQLYQAYNDPTNFQNESKPILLYLNVSIATFEIFNLTVKEVSIQNSYGFGLLAVNSYNLLIDKSSFSKSNFHITSSGCISPTKFLTYSANLALYYFNPIKCPDYPVIYSSKILSTNVSFGLNLCLTISEQFEGSGLRIVMAQSGKVYGIDVLIDNSIFYGNTAIIGSNILIKTFRSVIYYTITMTNSIITKANMHNSVKAMDITSIAGSGIYILNGIIDFQFRDYCAFTSTVEHQLHYPLQPIVLKHNIFSYNFGDVIEIDYISLDNYNNIQEIIIAFTEIANNTGNVLFLTGQLGIFNAPFSIIMEGVTITDNVSPYALSSIEIIAIRNLTMKNVEIADNIGTGVYVTDSVLILTGNVTFRNNSSTRGGALYLQGNCYVILLAPVELFIIDNNAGDFGGGIFVDTTSLTPICFLQVIVTYRDWLHYGNKSFQLSFFNNTSGVTGSLLYGGNIGECQIIALSYYFVRKNAHHPINFIRKYNYISNDSFAVSSDAGRVCFCDKNVQNCSRYAIKRECYPGDDVRFSMITVGQGLGAATGVVKATEVADGKYVNSILTSWREPFCNIFNYTVNVKNLNDSVQLILSISFDNSRNAPVYLDTNITVEVKVLNCPPGFELSSRGQCDCDQALILTDKNITCSITNNTIRRSGNVWIGYNVNTSCLITHKNCPFDYCNRDQVTFTITEPGEQCAINRSGLLCGQCSDGMSVLLGSNRCAKCPNLYVALFLAFSIAGIVLIALMFLLNLTVSLGIFNGLIFFANIVKLNDFVFFPNGPIPFISQFISWINLDLGIETCLFNGMNDYIKIWLQFAFPFYIWIVIGIIVALSRYTKFHRIIGRNAIKVLATLILLSFTKLLRTVTLSLSSVLLPCKGSSIIIHSWYADPNIDFFSKKLVALLVMALAVTITLIIPYTLLLLFCQLIEKSLTWRRLQCCGRHWLSIKPFFDAYAGPYKDDYQFWTGLLLLARISLLSTILFTRTPSIAIAAIVTTIAILLSLLVMMKGVYNCLYHDLLECCYMLILVLMCSLAVNGHSEIGTILGVSLAFVLFSVSLIYHLIVQIKKTDIYKRFTQIQRNDLTTYGELETNALVVDSENNDIRFKVKSTTTISICKREPLIYDDDDHDHGSLFT